MRKINELMTLSLSKRGKMQVIVNIKKRHLYGFLAGLILILGAFFVTAFGGSSPAVVGHSALELLVNGSSIADGNVTSAHILNGNITGTDIASNTVTGSNIDESTLSGTAAGLNIGGNAATATTASNSNACNADGVCQMTSANIASGTTIIDSTGISGTLEATITSTDNNALRVANGGLSFDSGVKGIAWSGINSGNPLITGNGNLEIGRAPISMLFAANLITITTGVTTTGAGKALCVHGTLTSGGALGMCTSGVGGDGSCQCD